MDQNIKAFLRVLDASDNSTGGGTASSVAGAMAAGLAAMVARLSMGKKDLAPREHYEKIAIQAEAIAGHLFDGGREDAAAFDRVSSAYKLPKETGEDKATRSLEIQKAMMYAASNQTGKQNRFPLKRRSTAILKTHNGSKIFCGNFAKRFPPG